MRQKTELAIYDVALIGYTALTIFAVLKTAIDFF